MSLFDPIRLKNVPSTPEEVIRQKWIQAMIERLGYPRSLLSIEKELSSFAKEKSSFQNNRRIDLLCYTPHKEGLLPLLVIEFKAESLSLSALEQLLGYNQLIQAPFCSVIGKDSVKTLWIEKGKRKEISFLPTYQDLRGSLGF